jgi:hypothetical protein
MRDWHPAEGELAGLSSEPAGGGILEHVRFCARCRSVLADHNWLQQELSEALRSVANEICVPRPAWWEVQGLLLENRRRQSLRTQVSAAVSAAVAVCVLLCVPGFMRPAAVARGLQPEVSVRPTPVMVPQPSLVRGTSRSSRTSAVLTVSRSASESSRGPALVPLPTPPGSDW